LSWVTLYHAIVSSGFLPTTLHRNSNPGISPVPDKWIFRITPKVGSAAGIVLYRMAGKEIHLFNSTQL